jgi:hypothetical protein
LRNENPTNHKNQIECGSPFAKASEDKMLNLEFGMKTLKIKKHREMQQNEVKTRGILRE